MPEEDRSSLFGTVHQDITPDVSVFAEGLYTSRTGNDIETIPGYFSYYNKYQSQIYAFNFGANWEIDQDWHANITGTISHDHSRGSTYFNVGGPLAGGDNYDNGMYAVEALVNGTVEGLPTGDISVALGGGYRAENFCQRRRGQQFRPQRILHIRRGARSADHRIGGSRRLEKLELSIDGRFEHYSDFGSTTNPKLGLLYVPVTGLSVRSTWGTSFRAPGLYIEDGPRQAYAYPYVYYAGTPAGSQVLLLGGANRDLKPEKSETWTAGADINPDFLPDLKARLHRVRHRPIATVSSRLWSIAVSPS